MSVEKVRAYLEPFGVSDRIREFDVSSATVELAAVAVGVEPPHCQDPELSPGRRSHSGGDRRRRQNRQQQI